jgi:hypothetical protein
MVSRYYQWSRVNSPAVKGWPRSGRGSSALTETRHKIPNAKLQVNSKRQNQNSKPTLKSERAITRALTGLLHYPGAARHPSSRGELADESLTME